MTYYIDIDKEYYDNYDMSKLTQLINNKRVISNSYFLHKLRKLPIEKYIKVNYQIMRADTISYEEYGFNEEFWWLILYYNGISKFQDLTQSRVIKLFKLIDLDNLLNECILKQQLINVEES